MPAISGRIIVTASRNAGPVLVSLGGGRGGVVSKRGSTRSTASSACRGTSTRHGGLSGRSRRGHCGQGCRSPSSRGNDPCHCLSARGRGFVVRVYALFLGGRGPVTTPSGVVYRVFASGRQVRGKGGHRRDAKTGASLSIVSPAIKANRGLSTSMLGVGRKVSDSRAGLAVRKVGRTTSQSGLLRDGPAVSWAGRGPVSNVYGSVEATVTVLVLQAVCQMRCGAAMAQAACRINWAVSRGNCPGRGCLSGTAMATVRRSRH